VVAEGVETAEEHLVLRGLHVDHGQGWFYGRPGPAEALSPLAPAPSAVPLPRAPASAAFAT
jgi:EAL domain-containing protein (putative c-di-GMP-specific phosphodiesterase class I)